LLSKAHFDDAMRTARKSVSKTELARYLKFKKELEGGKGIAQAMAAGASDDPSEEASAAAPQPSPPPAAAESGKGDDEDLYA